MILDTQTPTQRAAKRLSNTVAALDATTARGEHARAVTVARDAAWSELGCVR